MIIEVIDLKYFIDRLIERIEETNSRICVGLDPHLDLIPDHIFQEVEDSGKTEKEMFAAGVWKFNKKIIDKIYDLAVAVKPQIAFYENIGPSGMRSLEKTISYASKKGLIVILDAKRNDIGSTAEAYASAYLDNENIDAITINPYLGFDGIAPFIKRKDKGAFALVRTSNKSAGDIQDLVSDQGRKIYEHVGKMVEKWGEDLTGRNGYSNLGAVIGATYPDELKCLRGLMPGVFFLIPGYGAQGGGAKDIVSGFDKAGLGSIVNSARGIIFAYRKYQKYDIEDFALAARKAASEMKEDINNHIYL